MNPQTSISNHRTIIEPFKIKMVEPLTLKTKVEREQVLKKAYYNLFLIKAEDVTFDFLTDSGTTAMSARQWAAMLIADESYAGSRSFYKFKNQVEKLTGYEQVIPTHQGRAAEKTLFSVLLKSGMKVPSNNHFDTTRANIEALGAQAVDLVIPEGKMPEAEHPFKGNIDLSRLDSFCKEFKDQIPFGMLTITNNTGGGQPVSLENLRAASQVYKKYNIPFILDACRFAENAYFIKAREPGYQSSSILQIAQEMFSLADGCLMSAKKDALVNIGGFIALKNSTWVTDIKNQLILTEGFPTYGGLAARDIEAMAVGLEEVLDEDYLKYRIATSEYMNHRLNKMGIPTVRPAGGHAVYVDAKKYLPQIPSHEFPGQALACELYLEDGIRSCEIGSVMFKEAATMELVRLAFPRRVYTQSHFDYILETFEVIHQRRNTLKGFKIIEAPKLLRHFTAKFERL